MLVSRYSQACSLCIASRHDSDFTRKRRWHRHQSRLARCSKWHNSAPFAERALPLGKLWALWGKLCWRSRLSSWCFCSMPLLPGLLRNLYWDGSMPCLVPQVNRRSSCSRTDGTLCGGEDSPHGHNLYYGKQWSVDPGRSGRRRVPHLNWGPLLRPGKMFLAAGEVSTLMLLLLICGEHAKM